MGPESEIAMFDEILMALRHWLRSSGLQQHVVRVWVYKDVCPVVDFSYRGLQFGFNVLPQSDGHFALSIVQRQKNHLFRLNASGAHKVEVASGLSRDQCFEHIRERMRDLMSKVDKFVGTQDTAAPDSTSTEQLQVVGAARRRVGVLTLPLGSNIGGILQAYALMEVLRQLGHLPVLINRRKPWENKSGKGTDDATPLLSNRLDTPEVLIQEFVERHATPISRAFYTSAQLAATIARYEFDAVIVGSDQVWRPKYGRALLNDFFLGFLPEQNRRVRRLSYAASFGAPQWEYDDKQTRDASVLVKRFDAVSVREDSAVNLCRKHLGVEATHVLDPTLLLPADHYVDLLAQKSGGKGSGQLLAYVLDRTPDKKSVINKLSAALSVRAYSTNGQPFEGDADTDGDKSIEGWLASIHEAKFVVTDSFHGTVFSILFNRPFLAYGNPSRGMARFTSLLKMFRLEDRLVVHSDVVDLDKLLQPVDWSAVNDSLQRLRATSIGFLDGVLLKGS